MVAIAVTSVEPSAPACTGKRAATPSVPETVSATAVESMLEGTTIW